MTADIKTVFVTQYGGWWKLSLKEWLDLCTEAMKGDGYLLPDERMLRRRPWSQVGCDSSTQAEGNSTSRLSYYPLKPDAIVVTPLDWEPEDFEDSWKDLTEKAPSPQTA